VGDDSPEGFVSLAVAVVVYAKEGVSVVCDKFPKRGDVGLARTINGRAVGGGLGSSDPRGKRRGNSASADHRIGIAEVREAVVLSCTVSINDACGPAAASQPVILGKDYAAHSRAMDDQRLDCVFPGVSSVATLAAG
jgi:hypothetical protein